ARPNAWFTPRVETRPMTGTTFGMAASPAERADDGSAWRSGTDRRLLRVTLVLLARDLWRRRRPGGDLPGSAGGGARLDQSTPAPSEFGPARHRLRRRLDDGGAGRARVSRRRRRSGPGHGRSDARTRAGVSQARDGGDR